ncbi:MAG: glycosyltransferase [Chloroflexi bacterium]|nr:glycosyltransferase [Chloroflexota bacterium]
MEPPLAPLPLVTVAVPLLNEAPRFPALLQALLAQTYPAQRLQVLLLDGGSTDGTLELARAAAQAHAHISVHENPGRSAAAALNLALTLTHGVLFARIDARCRPAPDYVATAVARLQTGRWAGVGGPQVATGASWPGKVVAGMLNHPLGTGAPRYRRTIKPHPSETLFLGAYDRGWLAKVGGWDERFAANEDFELNWRLRQAGGQLLVDPAIRSRYVVRGDLRELGRQYARYGAWRLITWRRHPRSIRLRHVAPALLVLALTGGLLALPFAAWPLLLGAGAYLGLVLAAALDLSRQLGPRALPRAVAALMTVHLAWGISFWLVALGLRQPPR